MDISTDASRTILVIDADVLSRKRAEKYVQQAGFAVISAKDGTQGVRLAKEHQPDLILCDLMGEEIDGFDVLRATRETESTALIPFVILTSNDDLGAFRQGMELGADDYLYKPVNRAELLSAIHSQLIKRQRLVGSHKEQHARMERAKRRLSLMMAHELRTPLITINMTQDLLWLQLDDLSRDEIRELVSMMGSGTRRLKHLIEQMVLLTQVETGILHPKTIHEHMHPILLDELLSAAINLAAQFTFRTEDIPVNFSTMNVNIPITCNVNSLQHALAELISNAINFSPPDEPVHIAYHNTEDVAWIVIADAGPGIPPDQLHLALEDFQQIERDKNEQQGIGMGLPLAHRIITAHEGSLELMSVPQGGTQAIIGLPIN